MKGRRRISVTDVSDLSDISHEHSTCHNIHISQLVVLRALVFLSLSITAALCGSFAYSLLKTAEDRTFRSQYSLASSEGMAAIDSALIRATYSAEAMSKVVGLTYPYVHSWPNAFVSGYNFISDSFKDIARVVTASMPIVYPDMVSSFESYVSAIYGEELTIFSINSTGAYHDTTGETTYSTRNILTPVLHYNDESLFQGWRMFNVHSDMSIGIGMDRVLDCVDAGHINCTVLTDFIASNNLGLVSVILAPVFPFYDNGTVVGFQAALFQWETFVEDLKPSRVRDMDLVVTTVTQQYTFSVGEGGLHLKGKGDLHDRSFSHFVVEKSLYIETSMAMMSGNYVLSLYPTEDMRRSFRTELPITVSLVSVGIVLLTSIVFFTYDYYVHKESTAKKQVLSAKRAFVRLVSHEIRTPLNTVTMGLKLLEDELRVGDLSCSDETQPFEHYVSGSTKEALTARDDKLLHITGEIKENTDVAVTVLNDLLQYDKITMGKLEIELKPVNIFRLIEQTVHPFFIQAVHAGINLTVTCGDQSDEIVSTEEDSGNFSLLYVIGDRARLAQVIRNIVSNALKFTPHGGYIGVCIQWDKQSSLIPPVSGEVVAQAAGAVLVSVKDSGPGISKENQKQLFGEGVQFNPNELQGGQGSGLGLWISKSIVELHQGNIWAVSEGSGTGSTFNVELPVVISQRPLLPDDEMSLNVTDFSTSTKPENSPATFSTAPRRDATKKILVVDDAKSNRKFLCHLLRRRGYICDEAVDGVECVNIMKSPGAGEYSCILMDFQMPNMNGPEATETIRKMGFSRLKIIGVTGNIMAEDIDVFIRSGADLVLHKPLDIGVFEDVMSRVSSSCRHGNCCMRTSSSCRNGNYNVQNGDEKV